MVGVQNLHQLPDLRIECLDLIIMKELFERGAVQHAVSLLIDSLERREGLEQAVARDCNFPLLGGRVVRTSNSSSNSPKAAMRVTNCSIIRQN